MSYSKLLDHLTIFSAPKLSACQALTFNSTLQAAWCYDVWSTYYLLYCVIMLILASIFLSMSKSPWIDWFWLLLSVSHCRLIKISLSATYSGSFVMALMRDLCVEAASHRCSSFPLTHRWNVNNCQVIMWPSPCAGLSNPKVNMQLNCVKTCCPTPLPECLTFLRDSLGPVCLHEIILSTLG